MIYNVAIFGVFLLASLIPLGMVVGESGTAAWIAKEVVALLSTTAVDGSISYAPQWVILASIATLATAFTLVIFIYVSVCSVKLECIGYKV